LIVAAMTVSERIDAAIVAFLAAAKWSPRRLSVEAGLGQSIVARRLAGCGITVESADALLAAIRRNAPDTPEGRRARALAMLWAPAQHVANGAYCAGGAEKAA